MRGLSPLDAVRRALERDRTIDITTIGARTGEPRRIETWFYRVGGAIYLTGDPGRRGWYANLRANPAFTFHLKGTAVADLAAHATPVTDDAERRRVMREILDGLRRPGDLEAWVAGSPLVEVTFDG